MMEIIWPESLKSLLCGSLRKFADLYDFFLYIHRCGWILLYIIHSCNLCLLNGDFRLFTFTVIINMATFQFAIFAFYQISFFVFLLHV